MSVITALLYLVASTFAKTSILAIYERIFSPSRRFHILILSGIIFNIVLYISLIIVTAWACTPKSEDYATGGWLSPKVADRCTRYTSKTMAASGVVGAVVDVYILLLPLFFVLNLHTSTRHKAGLAAIFILGSAYVSPTTTHLTHFRYLKSH